MINFLKLLLKHNYKLSVQAYLSVLGYLSLLFYCIQVSEIIVQTDETARQQFFLKIFLNLNIPLLFVGPTGTGKSAIVLNHLVLLPKDKYMANVINFSARTSANQTQDMILSKLDR